MLRRATPTNKVKLRSVRPFGSNDKEQARQSSTLRHPFLVVMNDHNQIGIVVYQKGFGFFRDTLHVLKTLINPVRSDFNEPGKEKSNG